MKRRHFFTAMMVAALLLVGFNFYVRRLASNLPPQQLLRYIQTNAPLAQWAFLGDSQMQAGADPKAFSNGCPAKPAAINVALGATCASEHCLILEYLLPRAPAVETIVYGFHDNILTELVPGAWRDLVGNRAMVYLFPDRASALLTPGDQFKAWRMRWSASVPMIAERVAIWAKVERLRRQLSEAGLPVQTVNRFGRVKDFSTFEPRDAEVFESNLKTTVEMERPLNLSVQQIVKTCASRNLKFCLVEMPIPALHRRRYYETGAWTSYREYLRKLVGRDSGIYIEASNWVSDEGFSDSVHLNTAGAALFSERLAQELCDRVAGNISLRTSADAESTQITLTVNH
jgi:hypothetical protein